MGNRSVKKGSTTEQLSSWTDELDQHYYEEIAPQLVPDIEITREITPQLPDTRDKIEVSPSPQLTDAEVYKYMYNN
jgi:hypothetical protein